MSDDEKKPENVPDLSGLSGMDLIIPKDERPEEDLADDVETRPTADGRRAAVAVKAGVDVCWNCFDVLIEFADIPMGHATIRVCKTRECVRAVMNTNAKRKTERNILDV